MGESRTITRVVIVWEATAAMRMFSKQLIQHGLEPILKAIDSKAYGRYQLALVTLSTGDPYSEFSVEGSGWTLNVSDIRDCLQTVQYVGGGRCELPIAEAFREVLYLQSCPPPAPVESSHIFLVTVSDIDRQSSHAMNLYIQNLPIDVPEHHGRLQLQLDALCNNHVHVSYLSTKTKQWMGLMTRAIVKAEAQAHDKDSVLVKAGVPTLMCRLSAKWPMARQALNRHAEEYLASKGYAPQYIAQLLAPTAPTANTPTAAMAVAAAGAFSSPGKTAQMHSQTPPVGVASPAPGPAPASAMTLMGPPPPQPQNGSVTMATAAGNGAPVSIVGTNPQTSLPANMQRQQQQQQQQNAQKHFNLMHKLQQDQQQQQQQQLQHPLPGTGAVPPIAPFQGRAAVPAVSKPGAASAQLQPPAQLVLQQQQQQQQQQAAHHQQQAQQLAFAHQQQQQQLQQLQQQQQQQQHAQQNTQHRLLHQQQQQQQQRQPQPQQPQPQPQQQQHHPQAIGPSSGQAPTSMLALQQQPNMQQSQPHATPQGAMNVPRAHFQVWKGVVCITQQCAGGQGPGVLEVFEAVGEASQPLQVPFGHRLLIVRIASQASLQKNLKLLADKKDRIKQIRIRAVEMRAAFTHVSQMLKPGPPNTQNMALIQEGDFILLLVPSNSAPHTFNAMMFPKSLLQSTPTS